MHYAIAPSSDPGRRFAVDSTGRVRLQRGLDREASPHHTVLVLAMDRGEPPRTSTATLLITLSDINDNAPHVASPDGIFVTENSGPQHVADLTLDDPDDWSLGHGPPFSVTLDSHAPRHIKETFAVDFDQSKCLPEAFFCRFPSLAASSVGPSIHDSLCKYVTLLRTPQVFP